MHLSVMAVQIRSSSSSSLLERINANYKTRLRSHTSSRGDPPSLRQRRRQRVFAASHNERDAETRRRQDARVRRFAAYSRPGLARLPLGADRAANNDDVMRRPYVLNGNERARALAQDISGKLTLGCVCISPI